jgi:aspartyl-tRNA(Asn)/glutamyl-tRNA(Gln) amidotransferase subunit C
MPRSILETVDHVARLAYLSLTDDERPVFAAQLEQILAYARTLETLDVSDVPPMSHAAAAATLRDDEPRPSLDRERVLEAAPDSALGLFRVPRIIGG